ncbi:MAG: hypothetical protein Q9160_000040 [Pyrenula sp. 1 TL-2023]
MSDEKTEGGDDVPPEEVENRLPSNTTSLHSPTMTQTMTGTSESERLKSLQAEVRDQDDLERDIGRQADRLLLEQANERDQHRLEKTLSQKEKLESQVRTLQERIHQPIGITLRSKLKNDVERLQNQITALSQDVDDIKERMEQREAESTHRTTNAKASSSGRLSNESQRDFLIRTGKITPFSRVGAGNIARSSSNLQDALLDAEEESDEEAYQETRQQDYQLSHRNLKAPGFRNFDVDSDESNIDSVAPPAKKRRLQRSNQSEDAVQQSSEAEADASFHDGSAESTDDDFMPDTQAPIQSRRRTKEVGVALAEEEAEDLRGVDDGRESVFRSRLRRWITMRKRVRRKAENRNSVPHDAQTIEQSTRDISPEIDLSEGPEAEWHLPHPTIPDADLGQGFKIPGDIYPSLFDYQKTGVQWLWELYTQQVGGIIGDEMGLGKTIQVISFLAGLHYSGLLDHPVVVVCPATVMKQWVNEFHRWWPPFRVTILHASGTGMINLKRESTHEDELLTQMWNPDHQQKRLTAGQKSAEKVLQGALKPGNVIVTTYSGLQTYAPVLIPIDWSYAILDEGHKIRNPNAAITIYCKELKTPNRVILSGTPMQNNLQELWSLFDFVFPMRLGTLVSFRTQFDIPIRQGGYANASNLQVQTAFKCAETLKDAISPYLLQRFKVDVAADLPKKSEQVLFCHLTKPQRVAYEKFLQSNDMSSIMSGKRQVLYGVDILRKICNHPDLQDHRFLSSKPNYNYGNPTKSGKMQVVGSLLELWRETGHKTLLFAQHRIMLDILEKFIKSSKGFRYRRMDGNTPIQARQSMVDEFNNDADLHIFLLTTKVGGLGVNLTGADRVIIFDPDWNPSTDLQARERAWRLGQKREVTIYRLMTAGTIEEKIYHRQIFKQFLTNKILRDPKQRQTFHLSDLHDLFSLGNEGGPTETSALFKDAEVRYRGPSELSDKTKYSNNTNIQEDPVRNTGIDDSSVRDITGVASLENFAEPDKETAAQKGTIEPIRPSDEAAVNSEDRVMASLFSRSGIHSALEHEQIVAGPSGKDRPRRADPAMIEAEAKKVASEAAKELRRAGEVAKSIPAGTPTWTGNFGVAGRPQEMTAQRAFAGRNARGGALGSANILSNLSNRHGDSLSVASGTASPASGSSRANTPSATSTSGASRGRDFGKMIQDFLLRHDGQVPTQMLIDHFNRFCNTPQSTMEFKETLKIIASLERGGRGRSKWVLKDEYKPT